MIKNCSNTSGENAFAYFHGHEVGGTNHPFLRLLSLLSSISCWILALTVKSVKMGRSIGRKINWHMSSIQAEQMDTQAIEDLNQNQVNGLLKPLLGKNCYRPRESI